MGATASRHGGLLIDHSVPDVLILCLDRPASRNAIDGPLAEALLTEMHSVTSRVIVLGSVDPGCFCAGADLTLDDSNRALLSERLYELYASMIELELPIVAATGGHAVGGGAQLALAADLRIGNRQTQFRFLGVGHGLVVGAWALPSLVGRGRALHYCTTMRVIPAEEALAVGLVDEIADDAFASAVKVARNLTTLDRGALGRLKAVVREASDLRGALAREREVNRGWSGRVNPAPEHRAPSSRDLS